MTTPSPTTELEAVNIILGTIGESPVNSLGGGANADVSFAQKILAEVNKAVQDEGWHFNTEYDWTLAPDQDGYIKPPANTISVDADTETDFDITVRGDKLYDKKGKTNKFTRSLKCELTLFFPFDELPECARQYITIRAARIFQDRVMGSEALHQFNKEDEQRARVRLESEEGSTGDHTIFDSRLIGLIVDRGPRRYTGR